MATVKSFEELYCWQKARELVKFIYEISKHGNFEKDKGLQDQIRRAAVSVMSNIAEGFDRGTRQELINYLFIAKGSCGEVRCQLYASYDIRYIDMPTFRDGLKLTDECSRLLKSFINKVKTGSHLGLQYKKEYKKGMSDVNKMTLERMPEMKEYYNAEKDEIEWWRKAEDERRKI
ncbi:MAG: hypothetical protein A2941_02495 [Candidatus Yanofskybacteria bacterium RIFCSPLOWO2_01_FULL_49_17]|uniref:Four helix bundle protein n=1 Tax=Candidatus Yanofskybacteria bacterium RIFCSPLOWO2_01_FULL_49_17 TaxID=1802700 RepID=A0A1F8GQS3_9BACT|nr:MAG: hypothetical protein A2941_02495 [Candidatus Yanofskybacteria bacterium RIFCSPLOWO2_01_FULL_49_17]